MIIYLKKGGLKYNLDRFFSIKKLLSLVRQTFDSKEESLKATKELISNPKAKKKEV
jgi:hypothetical protein